MCDKVTCNDASCCGECEPWNCVEQQINDALATKEDQLQGYVNEAKDAAAESKASAEASAQSAAESKEFRDEAETAASTAVAAEGVVLGVANTLQDTADKLEQIADELGTAIAGIAVSSWFYTTVSENQTVIPVPADKNAVDVQSIYIEGARQSPFRGFEFDKTAMIITLAEPLPLGLEIEIILGTYNSDNPNDFAHTLASPNGSALVGTKSGKTVQEELDEFSDPAVGDSKIAMKQPYPNSLSRTQHDKNLDTLSVKDFETLDAAIVAAISSGIGLFDNTSVLSVTVGTGGQFQTINAALDFLALSRPKPSVNGGLCEINLLSGFTLREQILLDGGVDFGWVKITSEDETVLVDASAITVVFSGLDSITPLFGATNGSTLPTIATLFDYSDNTTSKDGVAVLNGSKVGFLPGSGVLHCRNGLKVLYASEAYCYMPGLTIGGGGSGALAQVGVSFRYAQNRALHVAFGSRAGLARSDFRDSLGDVCIYVIWGSYVDLYQSSAKNSAGVAFHCRDGSGMNARQTEASYSLTGYHALHNSFINARSKSEVTEPVDPWSGEGAKGCRRYGVLASNNCVVEAVQLNVDNCTGSAGIAAVGASVVNFYDGSAQNCAIRGIWVQQGSTVNANTANVSNSPIGVEATEASNVAADNMVANACSSFGLLATNGAVISAGNLIAVGCARAIEARQFATISATQGANLSGSTDRAVSAIDGGNIYCGSANCTNAGSRGITARNGARVSAIGCDVTNAGAYGVEVQNGSTVSFNSGIDTKGLSQAVNTITANGIIFR